MTESDAEKLGAYLREQRETAGLSLRQVARLANMNDSYLGRLERGEQNPTIETLQKITDALSLNLNEVLSAIGVKMTQALPEPRVYFRRKFGVSEDDAETLARLIEKYTTKGGQKNGEDIEDNDD